MRFSTKSSLPAKPTFHKNTNKLFLDKQIYNLRL